MFHSNIPLFQNQTIHSSTAYIFKTQISISDYITILRFPRNETHISLQPLSDYVTVFHI